MVDNLNYTFIKDARTLFKWILFVFLGKMILNHISVIFFKLQNQNWTDTWTLVTEELLFLCQISSLFCRTSNATALSSLSDIFHHSRRENIDI